MLHTVPSFSIDDSGCYNGLQDGETLKEEMDEQQGLERTVTIGDSIEAMDDGKSSFGEKKMGLIEEEEGGEEQEVPDRIQNLDAEDEARPVSPPLYLATGLGVDSTGFDVGDDFDLSRNAEEHYRTMVDAHPYHPLALRNYAQFLQSNGDLHGAEEYYSRAVLADPGDGEIMAKYAKLIWDLHRDKDRALSYFQRAAEAAPHDSHVQAACASFLWEIDDDDEEEEHEYHLKLAHNESINASDVSNGGNIEEYYKKMVENSPNQPSVLKSYAQFLYQWNYMTSIRHIGIFILKEKHVQEDQGRPQRAEEYYSRAVQADPKDGELMAEYAKLVWELHHDGDKASSFFEKAVQAAPGNRDKSSEVKHYSEYNVGKLLKLNSQAFCSLLYSDVAGAYAHFLWENEEDEDDTVRQEDQIEVHA
ncbi:hypothetical protein FNV43_RR02485 [Rhamnella rubrinervis]|uniref:Uncharacterized protein n=1 Tax=Rhamnella rubrinervis TaxID=2594499 RepID=A0A8K0HSA2_9ROSA|nr:hypothetical protein FNV43_RR02485 [Rhamnella rubrinervis]